MKVQEIVIGSAFQRLTIKQNLGTTKEWRRMVLCKCSCGKEKTVRFDSLYSGRTTSCGCLQNEIVSKSTHSITHGEASNRNITAEYRTWANMINRCSNKKCERYNRYGERGISVCERWRNSYSEFLKDMGRKPTSKHSIERIDNNGNYEPSNCKWATMKEQANNRCKRGKRS